MFLAFLLLIVVGGGFLVFFFRANPPPLTRGASVGEHWHASYEIYICGKRMNNFPNVEGELHSHGDGFIHIHPQTPAATGELASLGTFLQTYETRLVQQPDGKRELAFPDGSEYSDGDRCPGDDERYNVRVTNKGRPIRGNPAEFLPHDGDAIVIQFGPRGETPMPNPFAEAKGLPQAPTTGGDETPVPDGQRPPGGPPEGEPAETEPAGTPDASPSPD